MDEFERVVDECVKTSLDTTRLDKHKIITLVKSLYSADGLKQPRFFLFADGPTEARVMLTKASTCHLSENEWINLSNSEDIMALSNAIKVNPYTLENLEQIPSSGLSFSIIAGLFNFANLTTHKNKILLEITSSVGLGRIWFFKDFVLISEKPTMIKLDNGVLHNPIGPVVTYADGTELYFFEGKRVPNRWIEERETLDPSSILAVRNIEYRVLGIRIIGYHRVKNQLSYEILQGNPETELGALVQMKFPGLPEPALFLEAKCPRNGIVFLGVPSENPFGDNERIVTAMGAQAFLAQMSSLEYQYLHPPIRK